MAYQHSGGFLSPAPSAASTKTSSTTALPPPRASPLKPGGTKESTFIRHVDSRILHIQRRFAKRTTPTGNGLSDEARDQADSWGDVKGYSSMKEACRNIGDLVDVVWVSGSPGLQVPYLINLALLLTTIVGAMPPTPKSLFRVLGKLDHAFASLLQGKDFETEETLPGFAGARGVSGTEKVRIRSLVERTRVGVMESFKRGEFEFEGEDNEPSGGVPMDTDDEDGLVLEGEDHENGRMNREEDDDTWDMGLARVYDRTIVELGDSLETPNIGIITEGMRRG